MFTAMSKTQKRRTGDVGFLKLLLIVWDQGPLVKPCLSRFHNLPDFDGDTWVKQCAVQKLADFGANCAQASKD